MISKFLFLLVLTFFISKPSLGGYVDKQEDYLEPITKTNNCKSFLASKNLVLKNTEIICFDDCGLHTHPKPNNELRKVTGKLIDLNDKVAVIQGSKVINYKTLKSIDNASGALLKLSNKTQWYINKDTLVLNGDSIRAYGNYVNNFTQSYTNAFNRVQKVKIPVIDTLCVESIYEGL